MDCWEGSGSLGDGMCNCRHILQKHTHITHTHTHTHITHTLSTCNDMMHIHICTCRFSMHREYPPVRESELIQVYSCVTLFD